MRIATWNINGLRARQEFVRHWLRSRQPDLVALQELKMDPFPADTFRGEGYEGVAHTQKAWNGVAILSRLPLLPAQIGLPGQEEQGARLVSARLDDLTLINVYCPNGKFVGHPDFQLKLKWLDDLLLFLRAHHRPQEPLILCGDFNICPAPLDSWNEGELAGTIFHTQAERERFTRLLDWGLVDLFRALHPGKQAFTWWDYRAGAFHRNQGLRIDFLLATPPLLKRVKQVEIDREYRKKKEGLTASDHAPVWVDLAG